MKRSHSIFSKEERAAIIEAATKLNNDFDYAEFLRLVAQAKAAKGYPDG